MFNMQNNQNLFIHPTYKNPRAKMDDNSSSSNANIELAGFRDVDSSSMDILKKNIGHHAKRISELAKKLEKLHITLKKVHEREKGEKYDIRAKVVDNGKVYASHAIDRNLFVAVDNALKKLANELD